MNAIIDHNQLKETLKLKNDAAIRRKLDQQGIVYFVDGQNHAWTTSDLIKLAGEIKLGLVKPANESML
jgi:hypothetical protein